MSCSCSWGSVDPLREVVKLREERGAEEVQELWPGRWRRRGDRRSLTGEVKSVKGSEASPGETNWRRKRRRAGEQSAEFRQGKEEDRRDQRCDCEGGGSREGRGIRATKRRERRRSDHRRRVRRRNEKDGGCDSEARKEEGRKDRRRRGAAGGRLRRELIELWGADLILMMGCCLFVYYRVSLSVMSPHADCRSIGWDPAGASPSCFLINIAVRSNGLSGTDSLLPTCGACVHTAWLCLYICLQVLFWCIYVDAPHRHPDVHIVRRARWRNHIVRCVMLPE